MGNLRGPNLLPIVPPTRGLVDPVWRWELRESERQREARMDDINRKYGIALGVLNIASTAVSAYQGFQGYKQDKAQLAKDSAIEEYYKRQVDIENPQPPKADATKLYTGGGSGRALQPMGTPSAVVEFSGELLQRKHQVGMSPRETFVKKDDLYRELITDIYNDKNLPWTTKAQLINQSRRSKDNNQTFYDGLRKSASQSQILNFEGSLEGIKEYVAKGESSTDDLEYGLQLIGELSSIVGNFSESGFALTFRLS